jgi:riboflavin synthase
MFSGIIQTIGRVVALVPQGEGVRLSIKHALATPALGASIACNGVCLTVVSVDAGAFSVDVSPETLRCTSFQHVQVGSRLNLEPSLRLGQSVDGHLVSGHVDGLAKIEDIQQVGDYYQLTITPPRALHCYIATKGSVCLHGVSLTVNKVDEHTFTVMIIPHTWQHTTLHEATVGGQLNVEIDQLARYVQRLLTFKTGVL